MKVVIILAIASGVFASNETCGENQRHTSCGTTCPLTCDNYNNPPDICNLMCFIGCECKEGYVRTADEQCVLPANCPNTDIRLGQSNGQTCNLPAETGVCRGLFLRYYFEKITGNCKKFIYGGCRGNSNNFQTVEECQNTCGNNTVSESACDQEKEIGPCMAAFRRFYFNKESGQCESFIYGGCQGNSNNFNRKDDCEAVCIQ